MNETKIKRTWESTKTVHLNERLHGECKKLAKDIGSSVQQIVNKATRQYINQKRLELGFQ
jgi:hypothetical protein